MEFHNHGKTGNKGRKEPLQIHIGADGGDLSLLSPDAEQTVGPRTRGKMSQREKSRSLSVVFSTGLDWKSPEQPVGGSSGRESLAWQDIPEAPLWPLVPLGDQHAKDKGATAAPSPDPAVPAWLTNAAGVAEGRAKGAGGLVGAPAQGWINQHHQDNVAVMACHGAWVVLSSMEMRSTPRAARVMHRNSRDLMGSAQTGPCKGPLSLPVNGASWMTIHKS